MIEKSGYLILMGVFGLVMFNVMKPYMNPDPKVINVNDSCQIIEYKNNYFLNCK